MAALYEQDAVLDSGDWQVIGGKKAIGASFGMFVSQGLNLSLVTNAGPYRWRFVSLVFARTHNLLVSIINQNAVSYTRQRATIETNQDQCALFPMRS
jgi:hypothetical protein